MRGHPQPTNQQAGSRKDRNTMSNNDMNRVSFKDVAIAFMSAGISGARSMLENPACANPYKTGLKAASFLADLNQEKGDLEAYLRTIKPTQGSHRVALTAGTSKEYTVQQTESSEGVLSDPWIRVPVGVLSCFKGGKARVSVSADGQSITVTRA